MVFTGCSSKPFTPRRAKPITVEHLRKISAPMNGLDHVRYMGSDAQFHYFHHIRLMGGGTYRVPRGEWKPRKEAPLSETDGVTLGYDGRAPR